MGTMQTPGTTRCRRLPHVVWRVVGAVGLVGVMAGCATLSGKQKGPSSEPPPAAVSVA
jgi:hypothetical protein